MIVHYVPPGWKDSPENHLEKALGPSLQERVFRTDEPADYGRLDCGSAGSSKMGTRRRMGRGELEGEHGVSGASQTGTRRRVRESGREEVVADAAEWTSTGGVRSGGSGSGNAAGGTESNSERNRDAVPPRTRTSRPEDEATGTVQLYDNGDVGDGEAEGTGMDKFGEVWGNFDSVPALLNLGGETTGWEFEDMSWVVASICCWRSCQIYVFG